MIEPDDMPDDFVYLVAKAGLFVGKGAEAYRREDAFHMPPAAWGEKRLRQLRDAMGQLSQCKGYKKECPLENIPIATQYDLAATLHFRIVGQELLESQGTPFLDQLSLRHRVMPKEVFLFVISGESP